MTPLIRRRQSALNPTTPSYADFCFRRKLSPEMTSRRPRPPPAVSQHSAAVVELRYDSDRWRRLLNSSETFPLSSSVIIRWPTDEWRQQQYQYDNNNNYYFHIVISCRMSWPAIVSSHHRLILLDRCNFTNLWISALKQTCKLSWVSADIIKILKNESVNSVQRFLLRKQSHDISGCAAVIILFRT